MALIGEIAKIVKKYGLDMFPKHMQGRGNDYKNMAELIKEEGEMIKTTEDKKAYVGSK
jgi:hypothetical protein